MASDDSASRPVPVLEYSGLPEVAKRSTSVHVRADEVETFGFLLGREMSAIGSGHRELAGDPGHLNDRWLTTVSPEGWVAVIAVEDVRPQRGLGRLSIRILSADMPAAAAADALSGLIESVRRAEVEAKLTSGEPYEWGIALGPAGELHASDERARHRFGGVYEWHDVTLAPLTEAYEGEARLADYVSYPYRVHRAWASGSVAAPTRELAQRLADRKALQISLFLSLLLRAAIEPAQSAASIVKGDSSDLARLFPRNLLSTPGSYVSETQAFQQDYGPTAPPDNPHVYVLPSDAPDLWLKACSIGSWEQGFWVALAAYRTACTLRVELPSLAFVALVSAAEALIDTSTLSRCHACGQYQGVGKAFETLLVPDGPETNGVARFARRAYDNRSRIVHDAELYGDEMMSRVGRPGAWAPDPAAQFLYAEWPALELLVARALLRFIRS